MITKEKTLCGKQVTLGYCFATEIAFADISGQDVNTFMQDVATGQDASAQPKIDPKRMVMLVVASIISAVQGGEPPVTERELLYNAKPHELIEAFVDVVNLRTEWYKVSDADKETAPEDTPSDDGDEGGRKNV